MYQIYNDDCFNIFPQIADNSIDMILCDLPYGLTHAKWDKGLDLDRLRKEYLRVLKPNGVITLFGIEPFTYRIMQVFHDEYSHCWYWKKNNKTGGLACKVQPMRCIEQILIFRNLSKYKKKGEGLRYYPQGLVKLDKPIINYAEQKKTSLYSSKKKGTIQYYTNYPNELLEFDNVGFNSEKRYHPTQKPVALLEYLIKTYTKENETILDNCMGVGSTGVACVKSNRNFIGIELNQDYYTIAERRINDAKENKT